MAKIDSDILQIEDQLIEFREYLHRNPELSLHEENTARFVREKLDQWAIPYECVGTGTLATLKGSKSGHTVLLRGDMDALPLQDLSEAPYASKNEGVCHACGHDAHTSALLGAAKILKDRQKEIPGTIKLCFQQAEEIGQGARRFVKAGYLDDVDFAFGIHVSSPRPSGTVSLVSGPINASCDIFTIRVHGKGAHCSRPQDGRDAALAIASILVALQSIVSRQRDPLEPVVISIGKLTAGSGYNVIAEEGSLEGTLRCFDKDQRKIYLEKIASISRAVAEVHGCRAEFESYNAANPLVNDPATTRYAQEIARGIVDEEKLECQSPVSLGAEDFADFSQATQAAFAFVGTQKDEKTSYAHHNGHFDIDESQLKLMVQLHVNVALNNTDWKKEEADI